jgi:hypothetical protein
MMNKEIKKNILSNRNLWYDKKRIKNKSTIPDLLWKSVSQHKVSLVFDDVLYFIDKTNDNKDSLKIEVQRLYDAHPLENDAIVASLVACYMYDITSLYCVYTTASFYEHNMMHHNHTILEYAFWNEKDVDLVHDVCEFILSLDAKSNTMSPTLFMYIVPMIMFTYRDTAMVISDIFELFFYYAPISVPRIVYVTKLIFRCLEIMKIKIPHGPLYYNSNKANSRTYRMKELPDDQYKDSESEYPVNPKSYYKHFVEYAVSHSLQMMQYLLSIPKHRFENNEYPSFEYNTETGDYAFASGNLEMMNLLLTNKNITLDFFVDYFVDMTYDTEDLDLQKKMVEILKRCFNITMEDEDV